MHYLSMLDDAALSGIPSPPGLRLLMEVRGPANPYEIIGADGGHAEFGAAGGRKVGDGDRPGPGLGFAEINAVNLHNPSAGGVGGGIPGQQGTAEGGIDGHGQGG